MANYNYDEAGNMAAYFLLTFLLIVLVPFSWPSSSSKPVYLTECDCQDCFEHRIRMRKYDTIPVRRYTFLAVGWAAFAFVAYKVSRADIESKVYNPFEILGINTGTPIKEIKSHYKKLSRVLHPDKVKLSANLTIEAVEARFVEITKAYKALTDETIRTNWERYGHPDGRQEVSMGIALPSWIVEGKNNIWVLGVYAIIFGGALPGLVGKWWFGNRKKTKDGVDARSAATFFKTLSEDSGIEDIAVSLGKTLEWEGVPATPSATGLPELETAIKERIGNKWDELVKAAEVLPGTSQNKRKGLVLLYAHFLRIPVPESLEADQTKLLLQTPVLLNSLLSICTTRNWLLPTLSAIRFQAYLIQAVPPGFDTLRFSQYPGVKADRALELTKKAEVTTDLLRVLEADGDFRHMEVKSAVAKWGQIDLVDASFKVIDDRLVTPSSIVFLVVKVRLVPPAGSTANPVGPASEKAINDDKRDYEFLTGKNEAEEGPKESRIQYAAHAPHWPGYRKPAFWVVLADAKTNRVVVPPMKITDVPHADSRHPDTYRSYKMQFQAPPQVATFTWKLHVVSDTFVGEEVSRDITLKIDDASLLEDEQEEEDDISEPEEDSLAGQMALMKGGSVKKRSEDDSDDESSTDDDRESNDESSSDSD